MLFAASLAAQDYPILPQRPTFNGTDIVFSYAGDLWRVGKDGVVVNDPAQARQGRDAQLEKAIAVAIEALAKSRAKKPAEPVYPNYAK